MSVLQWDPHPLFPADCKHVQIICLPASCPPIVGFEGNIEYTDTWDPARMRYFGSDLYFDPTKSASQSENQENAMYDIYDVNFDWGGKHPETTSCLGRLVGDNPMNPTDPGMFPSPTGLGWSRCFEETPAETTATQSTYVCAGMPGPC